MHLLKTIVAAGGLSLFGLVTFQQESAPRYHLDTLRAESYRTTRIFGVPVARRQSWVQDEFGDKYSAITGSEPAPTHWLMRRPDNVRSLWGETDSCFAFSEEFRERRDLLRAVYTGFPEKLSQAHAARYLHRIDELLPVDSSNPHSELDYEKIHQLRRELGLRSYFDSN